MPIAKRVKTGGSYFQGFKLVVSSGTGNYVQDITLSSQGCGVSSIALTPDKYGAGDYITVQHLDTAGNVKSPRGTLADTLYNVGAGATILLDFSALEVVDAGEKIRIIYTNVAGVALNLYAICERIR